MKHRRRYVRRRRGRLSNQERHDENNRTLWKKFVESKTLSLNGQHQVEVNLSYHSERVAACKPFTDF